MACCSACAEGKSCDGSPKLAAVVIEPFEARFGEIRDGIYGRAEAALEPLEELVAPVEACSACTDVRKSQGVRLLDIAVFGPLTVAAAVAGGPLPLALRGALAAYGVATVIYNWRNWTLTVEANADIDELGLLE